jgi:hypothetical protein
MRIGDEIQSNGVKGGRRAIIVDQLDQSNDPIQLKVWFFILELKLKFSKDQNILYYIGVEIILL